MKKITYKDVEKLGLKIHEERSEKIYSYSDLHSIDEDDDLLNVLDNREYETNKIDQYYEDVNICYYLENKNGNCVFGRATPTEIVEYIKLALKDLGNN